MRKILAALAALLAIRVGLAAYMRRFLPPTRGKIHLSGLQAPVEIIRDEWGVPHIYAQSETDLFFAQGYVHAQDRLWQMELQRRLGSGRLSEVLGGRALEIDRIFRTLGLRRAAEAEAETLDPEARRVLEAYAAGVNAYMTQRPGRLALEFSLLRFQPEPWSPVDSLNWAKVMAFNLGGNWASELIRARLAAKLGADLAADLEPRYPADNPPIVPGPGLPDGQEPPPNGWRSEALREALHLAQEIFKPAGPAPQPTDLPPGLRQGSGASNQWVVNGRRSVTGRPLLANDTHLILQLPSLWYQVHLVGGRYDVIGISFSGAPGVIIGHNQHCAWGLTTAWQDVQDLYVERFNPDNPRQYEYQGQWLDAEVVAESIRVRGRRQPVTHEVLITRHGPIVSGLVDEETPLALRWVALEKSNLLCSVLLYNRARNWAEFRAALGKWSTPGHNFVYADVEDNIAYIQAGWTPIRARGHGMAPAPGWSGAYEWQGYLPLEELPQVVNPASGWLATANNLVVDAEYPHFLSSDLENPIRATRIAALITAQPTLSIDDCARFQFDAYSAHAQRFTHHLLAIEPQNEMEYTALTFFDGWDYRLEPQSVAGCIYEVCRLRALHLMFDGHLEELADNYVGLGVTSLGDTSPYHGRSVVRLLELLDGQGDDYWLRDPVSGRRRPPLEVLHQALQETLALLDETLGHDMGRWRWQRLNQVYFGHTLGAIKPLNLIFNRGPYPIGGDHDTLLRASGYPQWPFKPIIGGDAMRFIADLSDWEQCRMVVPGGQSGHPASTHYADLIPLWRQARFQPMPFGRTAVELHARARLVLTGGEGESVRG